MLGTGLNISASVPLNTAVANWFVKKRGLAQGIRHVFSGLSAVLVLPFVAWLIISRGWRTALVVGGVIMWLVGLPLTWFFVKRHRPEYYGLLPDGATVEEETTETDRMIDRGVKYATEVEEVEFTLRQAVRAPAYWLILIAQAIHLAVGPSISLHIIPFLTDIGIDSFRAAGMIAITSLLSIPVRFFSGFLTDFVGRRRIRFLMGGAYFLEGAGIAVFLLNPTTTTIYVALFLFNAGVGAAWALYSLIIARYFGRKAYGSITGSSSLFMTPIGLAAPIYAGWVYDTTGSYMPVFALFAALLAFATVLMLVALLPKAPAEVSDIRKIM
jgi:sugar phosphate permease